MPDSPDTPQGPTPPAPPQPSEPPKKKRGGCLKVIAAVVGVVVLLTIIGAALGGGDDESSPAETEPVPTGAEEAASGGGKWVKVASLKGSTSKTSAPFKLEGGEQKLEYKLTGDEMMVVAIYVEKAGTDLMEEGGFPVVTPDKAGKDSTRLSKDEGEYQIMVESANCDWTVTLFEKR